MLVLLIPININILGQKIKTQLHMPPWHLVKRRDLNGLTTSSPPHSAPTAESGFPSQTTLLKRTRPSSYTSLSSRFHFPASSWHHSKKPITSSRSNYSFISPSCYYKACLMWPPAVHCVLSAAPIRLVWLAVSSHTEPWVYVTNKPTVSAVRCRALNVVCGHPCNLGAEFPPSPVGWIGGN